MSVTICWKQVAAAENHFSGGTSSSLKKLQQVFGENGIIGPGSIGTLRAMAVASGDSFFEQVADTVEQFGAIQVWGEY